ncbi:MAG: hypothetical protein IPO78_05185 [Saprospiraceae bacterium]|nr:hypothetical protein [Saprospiraceae bacterium]MBK9720997.1 hypothetical protein [Saprospiraceae bacterium]
MIKGFAVFVVLLLSSVLLAQTLPKLDRFNGTRSNDKVFLEWVISAGSTCNGIQLYRSTDTINFELIESILGDCGNLAFAQLYNYTDIKPEKNKTNYYRLETGSRVFSKIVSIDFLDYFNGYQIRPNPLQDRARLYFENPNRSKFQFNLLNQFGTDIVEQFTNEEYFQLELGHLIPGIYFFIVYDALRNSTIKGNLLIQ